MKKNPKKIITNCPARKEKGAIVKTECPSIQNVREVRKKLNALQRTGKAKEEELEKLREGLKKAKTEDVKDKFCENCHHKKKAG